MTWSGDKVAVYNMAAIETGYRFNIPLLRGLTVIEPNAALLWGNS